jgi:endo-1,4-beta-xylanase
MKVSTIFFLFFVMISVNIIGQNEPIVIEAESGILGDDYNILTAGDVTYIAPKTNYISTTNPGSSAKVASFTVTFSDSGTYKLFARVRVNSGGANDDSFFHGNGFGTKSPTSDDDWIICNNLHTAGFSISTDVVENQGSAPTGVWKWLSLSDYTGYETPITFRVEPGELTLTFQIGAREDGFDIDKIAFGRKGIYYTVDNLNRGEAGSVNPPEEEPIGPPLADGLDKFLGCSYGADSKTNFAGYWNQVTPENAGKWGSVEATRDVMTWTGLDEAYKEAMDNDFIFKHHVLVWGAQQPSWMATLDSAEQRAELEEWFSVVANRYPGLKLVEVVNEPLHQPPDDAHEGKYIKALGGAGKTGWDWIIEAFRMARAVFADSVKLMINEYSIMNSTTNTDQYLKIVKLLQADTLIDAIGFQGHGFSHNATNETILRNIDTLASTGLPIYVTELDIDGLTDLQHVHGYMRLFPLFWEHPAIKGITLWGFRPGMWRTDQGAYLIDSEGNERPAMLWLRAYLKGSFVPNESINIYTSTGGSSITTKNGTLQMMALVSPDTTTLKTVYWQVNNTNIATIDQKGLLTAKANGTVTVTATSLELNSTVKDEMVITISGQTTGWENLSDEGNINIYPNPSDGNIVIEGMQNTRQIDVFDLDGKQIFSAHLQNQPVVELSIDAPAGIYFVRFYEGERMMHRKILIK